MNTFILTVAICIGLISSIKLWYDIKKLKNKIERLQNQQTNIVVPSPEQNNVPATSFSTKLSENDNTLSSSLYSFELKITEHDTESTPKKKRKISIRKTPNPNLKQHNSNPEIPSRNKFLYGADNYGEMEEGVVLDSKTYYSDDYQNIGFDIIHPQENSTE